MKKNLALLGGRGAGKSTVARQVAESTGYPLVVLDELIEKQAGRSILDIVKQNSWTEFRELEYQTLLTLTASIDSIWDLGAGVVCEQDQSGRQTFSQRKAEIISQSCRVVWLSVSPATQRRRLSLDTTRPALTALSAYDEWDYLSQLRDPWYQKLSDVRIETDSLSVQEIAGDIIKWMGKII